MPIDPEDFLAEGEEYLKSGITVTRNGAKQHTSSGASGKWDNLYTRHGEGEGPFGGRNNALFQLVAFFRAKSFPFPVALSLARDWNRGYCDPPQSDDIIEDLFARQWYLWEEGEKADATPEDFQPAKKTPVVRTLLSTNDLLDLEENGNGLEWLVPNVFVKAGIHFVSAPAAGAKSWLMLDLARCMTAGVSWLGQFDIEVGAVMYVDEEMGENKTSSRVKKLGFERDTPFFYIGKQGIRLTNADDRKFIIESIKTHDVKLLCVDTLTSVVPGLKENESEHVSMLRSYFNEFTAAGATVLVAHHDRKGGQGDSNTAHERMAGSRDFGAMADMAYGIDKRGSVFHLSITKNRWLAEEDAVSLDFTIDDNEAKTEVEIRVLSSEERVQVNQRKNEATIEDRILDALSLNGAQNTRDLLALVEGSPNLVSQVLKKMVADGELSATKSGKQVIYELLALN